MKKFLLVTSALVAGSSIAVAGDIPATPIAPVIAGFTVTAYGDATVFGYYHGKTVDEPAVQYGIGAEFGATIEAAKTLDDGAEVFGQLYVYNGDDIEISVGYESTELGQFKAGVIYGEDEHDVEVPGIETLEIGDELYDGEFGLIFADASLGLYTSYAPAVTALTSADYSITYATPDFGGFKLGVGVDGAGDIDAAIAGSFAAGDALVSVGARYIATNAAGLDLGVASVGASVAIADFTIAADFESDFNAAENNKFTVAAGYISGPFSIMAEYAALVDETDKGMITAGLQYSDNGLKTVINGSYSLLDTGDTPEAWTAAAGVVYTFGDIAVGATVLASDNSASDTDVVVSGSAGVDYKLDDNVTIGTGLGYDGTDFAVAVGLQVSF
ncbi:MAG: hypothetical protein COB24_14640 [Hyphomicrobiales bacterium]|nr:MAG: hypothetical protein COB24_14640 [Hyphomicrobiales bacterium]